MKGHIMVLAALPLLLQGVAHAQNQAKPFCSLVPERVKQHDQTEYVASLKSEEWKNFGTRLEKELDAKIKVMSAALVGVETARKASLYFTIHNNRKLSEISVVKGSGNPIFDNICLAAVASLEGSPLLKFPEKPVLPALNESISLTSSEREGAIRQNLSERDIRKLMSLPVNQMHEMLILAPNDLHKSLDSITD